MAYRNMEQLAKKTQDIMLNTKHLSPYTLNIDELIKLYKMCQDNKYFEAVSMAFDYGFCCGVRAHDKQRVTAY